MKTVLPLLVLALIAVPLAGAAGPPPPLLEAGSSWSPDGSWIVYVSAGLINGDLYVLGVDSGSVTRLTTGGHNRDPAWSPDGRRIVYVHVRKYLDHEDVWLIGADGRRAPAQPRRREREHGGVIARRLADPVLGRRGSLRRRR